MVICLCLTELRYYLHISTVRQCAKPNVSIRCFFTTGCFELLITQHMQQKSLVYNSRFKVFSNCYIIKPVIGLLIFTCTQACFNGTALNLIKHHTNSQLSIDFNRLAGRGLWQSWQIQVVGLCAFSINKVVQSCYCAPAKINNRLVKKDRHRLTLIH